jgi:hypothetical protein
MEIGVGMKIVAVYRGEGKPEPSEYRGTVETVKVPKTAPQNGLMIVVKLDNEQGYRSFYVNKVEKLEVVG